MIGKDIKNLSFRRNIDHTYRQQLTDFILSGSWFLSNYFTFIIVAVVNDKPVGSIEGQVTGENYGYCAICGTPIIHHYTVTDSISKRSVNIGCECIEKVLGEQIGLMISKGVQSLQNKIKSDYLRPFKHDLLSTWLKKIAATDADDVRGQQILPVLIEYWEGSFPDCDIDEKISDTLDGHEGPFNYWKYHAFMFPSRDWNPDNMRSQYKKMAEEFETELPPKWSEIKLIDDQQHELNRRLVEKTNAYLKELNAKNPVYELLKTGIDAQSSTEVIFSALEGAMKKKMVELGIIHSTGPFSIESLKEFCSQKGYVLRKLETEKFIEQLNKKLV